VTPTLIRTIIVAIWLTAGVLALPSYLGFIWPDPASCIATLWPKYETVMEMSMYAVTCTIVVGVYTRIWNIVMHIELQHQQQQPSLAAAAISGTTSHSGRGNVDQHGIRMLWHHRQLVRKHRATRTIMVILASFICLFFPYYLSRLLIMVGLPVASLMQLVTSWIALLEFALHAFIYAIVNHDFRDAFKRILFCRASGSVAPETT